MDSSKENSAIGWGVSNYIKVSTVMGQYHANQPLSPHDTEKSSHTVMPVPLKVASFVDIITLAAVRGKSLARLDMYMMVHLCTFALYRFYGLNMLPHPSVVRGTGHMLWHRSVTRLWSQWFLTEGMQCTL